MRSAYILPVLLFCSLHTTAPAEDHPILFLKSRVNYAWGYTHDGFCIDTSGVILEYSFDRSDSLQYWGVNDTISREVFDHLLVKATPTGRTVDADTLRIMQELAASARDGELTMEGLCADYGIMRYSTFIFDSANERPAEIICYQLGDNTICNSSSSARVIARWLASIDSLTTPSCAPADSCLFPSTAIIQTGSPRTGSTGLPSALPEVYLNGQRVDRKAQRVIVGNDGKSPVTFSPDTRR